jgi:Flp pilus assembly protein TadG
MNTNRTTFSSSRRRCAISFVVRKVLKDERGQILPIVALLMTALLGMAGLVTDVGHAYVVRGELQNSANAAALAASGFVYDSSTTSVNATSMANQFNASSGGNNTVPNVGTVNTLVQTRCVNILMPTGQTCSTSSTANAVVVTNSTTVKTLFMALFGVKTLSVSATATASMQGNALPWNVAIILDGTASMVSNTDSNCIPGSSSSLSRLQCSLDGIQTFLGSTNPCPPGDSTCATGGKLLVSLFVFPNVTTGTVADDYGCNGTIPTHEPYTLPVASATSYTPLKYSTSSTSHGITTITSSWTATYQAVPFGSDYWSSGGISKTSDLAKAVGGVSGCKALNTDGGEGTYYAGAIYAAQAALVAAQVNNPGSNNAMILLSDGEASASSSQMAPPAATTGNGLSALTTTGVYPSAVDECQQAIVAAQQATLAGTRVYAVAYGSESSGCTTSSGGTDSKIVTLPATLNATYSMSGSNALTPCITMENIASSLQYFYSDANQSNSNSTCQDNAHPVSYLSQIFQAISGDFTTPRLIPNNAPGNAASTPAS